MAGEHVGDASAPAGQEDHRHHEGGRREHQHVEHRVRDRRPDVGEQVPGRRSCRPVDPGTVGGLDQQPQRHQEHDQCDSRRQHPAPRDAARRQEGQGQRLRDGDQRRPEVAVGGQCGHEGVGRPAQSGRRIRLPDAPDEEEAGRGHQEEGQGVAPHVLCELDVQRVHREQQPGQERDAAAEERAGEQDHDPQRTDGEEHGQAPECDLAVTHHDPPAQQHVVEHHVRLAVAHDVDEAVPGCRGQGGAHGLVEEEAVGAEEERPEDPPEHQLRRDGEPPVPRLVAPFGDHLRRHRGDGGHRARRHHARAALRSPPPLWEFNVSCA